MKKETNMIVTLRKQSWILLLLMVAAAIGCSADPRIPERVYLSGTVAPCTTTAEDDGERCGMRVVRNSSIASSGQASVSILDIEPLEHENIFAHELFEDTPIRRTHIIIRGEVIPGTHRCRELVGSSPAKFRPTPHPSTDNDSFALCFSDLAVHDYIYGEGPSRITVASDYAYLGHPDHGGLRGD